MCAASVDACLLPPVGDLITSPEYLRLQQITCRCAHELIRMLSWQDEQQWDASRLSAAAKRRILLYGVALGRVFSLAEAVPHANPTGTVGVSSEAGRDLAPSGGAVEAALAVNVVLAEGEAGGDAGAALDPGEAADDAAPAAGDADGEVGADLPPADDAVDPTAAEAEAAAAAATAAAAADIGVSREADEDPPGISAAGEAAAAAGEVDAEDGAAATTSGRGPPQWKPPQARTLGRVDLHLLWSSSN